MATKDGHNEGHNEESGEDSTRTLLLTIAKDMVALKEGMDNLTGTVKGLENRIMDKIEKVIKDETKTFNNEVALLKGRIEQIECKIQNGIVNSDAVFVIEKSVIILNLAQSDQEDVPAICQNLFSDVLDVDVRVVAAKRTRQRGPSKPVLIICQLESLDQKIQVLRNKKNVQSCEKTKDVFIAKMKTHEERLIGQHYRFTGSGRLVDKRQSSNRAPDHNGQGDISRSSNTDDDVATSTEPARSDWQTPRARRHQSTTHEESAKQTPGGSAGNRNGAGRGGSARGRGGGSEPRHSTRQHQMQGGRGGGYGGNRGRSGNRQY